MQDRRGCREWKTAPGYEGYDKVNCASCPVWDKEIEKCSDIQGVVQRYEDTPDFTEFNRMMRDNKGVHME